METLLITGGSGTIGMRLSELLTQKGYAIRHLSRSVSGNEKYTTFKWNVADNYLDEKALDDVDHIIHLAGSGVADGRWTEKRKKTIINSRVDTAGLLLNHLNDRPIKSFISASGISFYGSVTSDLIFTEAHAEGDDYLAQVSVKWEKAAFQFQQKVGRVAAFRIGVVLSETGGALEKIVKPIKYGIGSPLGSGKQYMPWIHLDDVCGIFIHGIENESIEGVYNAVASEHVTNKGMTQAIANVLGKKLWAPKVPAFLLKLLFGEMAVVVLEGSRIDNERIKAAGFTFNYSSLDKALMSLLKK